MRHVIPFFALFLGLACDSGDSGAPQTPRPGANAGSSGAGDGDGDGDGDRDDNVPSEERASEEGRAQVDDYVCGSFDPCGGDPVGTWDAREIGCNSDILELALGSTVPCRGALTAFELGISGRMEIGRDGSISLDFQYPGSREEVLDAECLEHVYRSADERACDLHESRNSNSDTHETTCVFENDRCACMTEVNVTYGGSGSYSLGGAGTTIDDGATESPFCVTGDTLTLHSTQADGSYAELIFDRFTILTECMSHSDCEGGLSCCLNDQSERTCEEAPSPLPVGDEPPVLCPEGLAPADSTNGEPCSDDYHCASRACIDSVCSVPPVIPDPIADGEPCSTDAECLSGSCYLGVCVAAAQLGAICTGDNDCDSFNCCTSLTPAVCGGESICPGAGIDECVHDDDCQDNDGAAGTCDDGHCTFECGEGLPECPQAGLSANYMYCVDALCRMECEYDEDCEEWLGSQYFCVPEQIIFDGEEMQVSVCTR